jgi:hypothetical protein
MLEDRKSRSYISALVPEDKYGYGRLATAPLVKYICTIPLERSLLFAPRFPNISFYSNDGAKMIYA